MITDYHIPEPFIFNPLKHHLGFIKEFIDSRIDEPAIDNKNLVRELKHLGTSVMDVYTGSLSITDICTEIYESLRERKILSTESFAHWAGIKWNSFRIITLADGSQWTLKFHKDSLRFVHFFPAREGRAGMHAGSTFRVKSNTLKSAILYNIIIGKDFISGDDLNKVRVLLGLSPIRDPADTEAITEMIEILRE